MHMPADGTCRCCARQWRPPGRWPWPRWRGGRARGGTLFRQALINHGDSHLYVPPGTTQITVAALGGAGTAGFPGNHLAVPGGAGGAGTSVSATFNVSPTSTVKPLGYLT